MSSKSKRPLPTIVRTRWSRLSSVIERMPETSLSATNRCVPSVARPLGCANAAFGRGAVDDVLHARTRPDADDPGFQVVVPDLVRSGHREEQGPRAWLLDDVPGAVQRRGLARGGPRAAVPCGLAAVARQRAHGLALEVDRPECVILGVGDVERVADQAHPLRAVEAGLVVGAIHQAGQTAADRPWGPCPGGR